ncbi:tetratricopeptide repeat protein [Minwuia thermotolerans]|uniref:Sel1 repeat family protein n=1 Tax=Minwuia thermotolerans TaxID=2056226 RepID=A0A2M9G634_9PROT|nr:tetratricopeptide repeat protein [Minwuia thermotolerans]PJK31170.1 hypothetical protein CVT23_02740 [Minwuia thermotolerans]
MTKRIVSLFAILFVCAPLAAAEASFRDGLEAYRAGDHPRAAEIWEEAARAGDPAAQRNLGLMYLNGVGVARDPETAADWFRRAAEQDFAPAAANLADLYLKGNGVEADAERAFRYMKQAAEGGLAESMHNLGILHESGYGTARDREAAIRWFRRAAELGFGRAAARLTEMGVDRQAPSDAEVRAPAGERPENGAGADTSQIESAPAPAGEESIASGPPPRNTELVNDGLVDHLVVLFSPDRQ